MSQLVELASKVSKLGDPGKLEVKDVDAAIVAQAIEIPKMAESQDKQFLKETLSNLAESRRNASLTADQLPRLELATAENLAQRMDNRAVAYTVSTFLTRLGVLLLTLFLVQFLATIYRYLMRLSAFYESRADMIEILGSPKPEELLQLSAAFSIQDLDFGKPPRTPAEHVVTLAKALVERVPGPK